MTSGADNRAPVSFSRGFTTVELLVVGGIIMVLATMATLDFMQWRNRHNSARGARGVYDALRIARSRAMSTNYQHMVRLEPVSGRYQVVKGTRGYGTPDNGWGTVIQEWITVAAGVSMTSGAGDASRASVNVKFNADGTARLETPAGHPLDPPASSVAIRLGGATANTVVVSSCGRVTLE